MQTRICFNPIGKPGQLIKQHSVPGGGTYLALPYIFTKFAKEGFCSWSRSILAFTRFVKASFYLHGDQIRLNNALSMLGF